MSTNPKKLGAVLAVMIAGVALLVGPVLAAEGDNVEQGGRHLFATLTGGNGGSAAITVNPGQEELCYELSAAGAGPATNAFIQNAPAGEDGPIVARLSPPGIFTFVSTGCVEVSRTLATDILQNPEDYYINILTIEQRGFCDPPNFLFPCTGGYRGQLAKG